MSRKLSLIHILDAPYTQPDKSAFDIDRIGVKASQFSFSPLHKADPVLGVDMSSTGEVGCIGDDFFEALLNAMIATGFRIDVYKRQVDVLVKQYGIPADRLKVDAGGGVDKFGQPILNRVVLVKSAN